ncbi:hypothetical protein [Streptomyces mirabilis]|uniref:hypothetical protein n=1 Tax=Streptomyces mirabilis TaxID=68239 RepID=UPI0006BAFE55|nr:hypothetical protein OK006_8914 [Actinobacteria bacterium OK006]
MNLARKLAAGAIAAGLTTAGVLAATPASATVVNSSCNLGDVVRVYYGNNGASYCYVWDGGSANQGWMNLPNSQVACSGTYVGYVQDTAGRTYSFGRGGCTNNIGGATLTRIVFTGN